MQVTRILTAALLTLPSIAVAHHAFRSIYDFSRTEKIQGAVVELELVNPHAFLHIDVTGDGRETARWVIEGPGRLALTRRGWTEDMFAQGETLTVVGNPSNIAERALWLEKIVRADGTEVIDPLVADQLAIEEDRRLQIQRSQQQ